MNSGLLNTAYTASTADLSGIARVMLMLLLVMLWSLTTFLTTPVFPFMMLFVVLTVAKCSSSDTNRISFLFMTLCIHFLVLECFDAQSLERVI
ncbi:hypothetical protein MT325_m169R [Paramecium bursaria chlorella virus MT325]|uniref:Uncharacterized protein m169R n=1 Tax=Paramecium bursaria Chlorella virus MT325 TaxID=346932 RepID=A7ITP9_PBCVM|nr:hypothetical protein MT325_m169R [Paramecium bursaria chlorella virus MT325]